MADNKKYYYLKLKDNFFDSEQMIILQNMQDGYLYSDILMKLYLRSLKTEGKLMFNNIIPYTPSVLAQVVRHQVGTVEKALKIFQQLNLIEVLDNGAIYMMDIQNFIGKSSSEGDRKREYRNKILGEKGVVDKCPDKRTPEIELEIEREIELELEKDNISSSLKENENGIFEFVEQNFGRTLSPIECEEISTWEDNELTRYAIKQAVLRNKCGIKYISRVLYAYGRENIKTVQQAQEREREYAEAKKMSGSGKTIHKAPVPEWFGKQIETKTVSKNEFDEMRELLKEFK